jgi:hypothetical protein
VLQLRLSRTTTVVAVATTIVVVVVATTAERTSNCFTQHTSQGMAEMSSLFCYLEFSKKKRAI